MSWEYRQDQTGRNGTYYTRTRRTAGGRQVRVYLGRGEEAKAAAAEDAQRQAERRAAVVVRDAETVRWRATSDAVDRVSRLISLVTNAALLTAGFHSNHGCWSRLYEQEK